MPFSSTMWPLSRRRAVCPSVRRAGARSARSRREWSSSPVGKNEVPAFPRLHGEVRGGIQRTARTWLECARRLGVADRWLCVRLGERMVPTRFNGWETALGITTASLVRYAAGEHAPAAPLAVGGLDLADYAVRFGLCQAEFQRRRGGDEELCILIEALRLAVQEHASEPELLRRVPGASAAAEAFFARVCGTIQETFRRGLRVEESSLPELGAMRPVHPRFAPFDPVEPLPWESKDPESYMTKMERLGYVI